MLTFGRGFIDRNSRTLSSTSRPLPEEDLEVMHHAEGVDSDSDRVQWLC